MRITTRARRRAAVVTAAAGVLAASSVVAATSASADDAGPTCRNGADRAEFYDTEGYDRTFNPGGLCLTAVSGYRSIFQADGNLVTYSDTNQAVWSTRTNGKGATRLVLQADGNMVIYNGGVALWASNTAGKHGYYGNFLQQTDGSALNIYEVNADGSTTQIW